MASRTASCFHSPPQGFHQPYEIAAGRKEDHHRHIISADLDSTGTGSGSESTAVKMTSLLYNLSVLKDKVNQVQALVTLLVSPSQGQPEPASVAAVASMGTLIQEIICAASSMLFACQQMPTNSNANQGHDAIMNPHPAGLLLHHQSSDNRLIDHMDGRDESSLYPETGLGWYDDPHNTTRTMVNLTDNDHINSSSSASRNNMAVGRPKSDQAPPQASGSIARLNSSNYDIIELDAAELLAKYTHYCQICGKGFKRDANLRMHMRAHGDEYKSSSALSNPLKKRTGPDLDQNIIDGGNEDGIDDKQVHKSPIRKYSCPHEGCRWNQRHANFQPLKSMICVKNHYKRSHCPKMYVCKRCNRKQFSVLSDLRTHEKHCGDLKWQCSCGTTFSRKDKLMGHVALFAGHSPMISLAKPGAAKVEQWSAMSMQIDDGQGNL